MNRLARVVAQGKHSVTLQLERTEKCAGCSGNCSKPLFKLFGMKQNTFTLSTLHNHYQINDHDDLLSQKLSVGFPLSIQISENDLYRFSGFLYLLPLLIIVAMLSLGHFMGAWFAMNTEIAAVLGLILGFWLSYLFFKKGMFQQHLKFRPIVTILNKHGTNC